MKTSLLIFTLSIFTLPAFAGLAEQVNHFQSLFGHPKDERTISKTSYNIGDTRPKAILKGVLYIGGSDKRRNLLSNDFKHKLCQDGFSKVYSVYKKVNNQVRCTGNQYSYTRIGEAKMGHSGGSKVYELFERIFNIINDKGNTGAIFIHCHYGVHASNTIAQLVLMQFCGISANQAKVNWDAIDLYDSLGEAGRQKQFRKIDLFTPYPEFKLSSKQKSLVCY